MPDNRGKEKTIKSIDGKSRRYVIEDEILRLQTDNHGKLIVFQKMLFPDEDRAEFRIGYYMLGFKAGARGRWVWGQFSLMVPEIELQFLLREAIRRKWFRRKMP